MPRTDRRQLGIWERVAPRLREGEVVSFEPGGSRYTVVHVSECAAYVRLQLSEPRRVELPNGRSFLARSAGDTIAISPHAFVIRH